MTSIESSHPQRHDSEIWTPNQQVITAVALIHRVIKGKPHVLMMRRAETKKFKPGVFELLGGHAEFGEELEACLAREVREEINRGIVVGKPFDAFTYVNEIRGTHSVEVVYAAQFTDGLDPDAIEINPDDHSGIAWISLDTMNEVYTETKGPDDREMQAVRRGLMLLGSSTLNLLY